MIENEILITVAGSAVLILITFLQIWAMNRAKHDHYRKMAALEKSLNFGSDIRRIIASDQRHCNSLFCNTGHLLQIIFGIAAFIGLTCWSLYLVSIGYIQWAPLPGSIALIGLMTPIIAWRGAKYRQDALNKMSQDIKLSQQYKLDEVSVIVTEVTEQEAFEIAQPLSATETLAPADENAGEVEDFAVSAPIENFSEFSETDSEGFLSTSEPAREAIPEATATPIPTPFIVPAAKPEVIIEKCKLPEDSILQRHFLTHLQIQLQMRYPAPTDSILRRHYYHFIGTQMARYIESPSSSFEEEKTASATHEGPLKSATIPPVQTPQAAAETSPHQFKIPKDSILKRHFLTQLISKIQVDLPSPPTDSILKRHYQTLLATEVEKRLTEMEH